MALFVILIGVAGIIGSLALGAYFLLEYAKRKTERSIAVFYRDQPMECVMMLNRISLIETKREISNLKHKEEHGF
jgi:hypothetical protein